MYWLTDIKNFAVGAVSTGASRSGRWGSWAFGFHGETYNRQGQFQGFSIGGLIPPALIMGLMFGPAAGLGFWLIGMVASAAAGMVTGFIGGGIREVSEGRAARKQWLDDLKRERAQERQAPQPQRTAERAPQQVREKDTPTQPQETPAAQTAESPQAQPASETPPLNRNIASTAPVAAMQDTPTQPLDPLTPVPSAPVPGGFTEQLLRERARRVSPPIAANSNQPPKAATAAAASGKPRFAEQILDEREQAALLLEEGRA